MKLLLQCRLFRILLANFLAITCLWSSTAVFADNDISAIRVSSRLDFNAILITEVDLVFVFDQQLADELPTLKGEWYSAKYDLIRNDPSGFELITISIPQGFDAVNVNLPPQSTTAVRVFAVGYHEEQNATVHELTRRNRVLVEIDDFGLLISEQP